MNRTLIADIISLNPTDKKFGSKIRPFQVYTDFIYMNQQQSIERERKETRLITIRYGGRVYSSFSEYNAKHIRKMHSF